MPIAWRPKEGDVTFRTLTLKDGGKIKEKLTGTEDLAYSYEIVESPFPSRTTKSKLWLEVDDEPDRSIIYWQSDFDANGASDDEAKAKITRNSRRRRQGHQEAGDRRLHDAKKPRPARRRKATRTTTTTISRRQRSRRISRRAFIPKCRVLNRKRLRLRLAPALSRLPLLHRT